MRHFLAYHNAEKMGYSCDAIPEPRVKTSKSVAGLHGVTVWLISGEGKSPKHYYLAAKFLANKCESGLYPSSDLPNQISGPGALFGKSKPIGGTPLHSLLKRQSANFVNGFFELHDPVAISGLERLV